MTWPDPASSLETGTASAVALKNVHILWSWHGVLVGFGPALVTIGALMWIAVQGWDVLIGIVAAVTAVLAIASGFPFLVVCGRRGLWRLTGFTPWPSVLGVGYTRTSRIASDDFENGNVVPVLVVQRRRGIRWSVMRELRANGTRSGRKDMEHKIAHLRQGGAMLITVPTEVTPRML